MSLHKKILLIAYNFPPLISPQSLRWFYLSRELAKMGHEIDVLTIRMPETFRDMLDELSNEIKRYPTFPGPFYHLTFKYSREPSNIKEPVPPAAPSPLWKMLSIVHAKAQRILNSLLIPDIYSEWLPIAVKAGSKLIKSNKYDIIISSTEPRVCHLVGYFLKNKSGISWIADYGDPWIYPVPTLHEPEFKKRIIVKVERKILKRADAITVAAVGIKRLYLNKYPFVDEGKIHVVTQGFDPEMFARVIGETTSKFRIVYCGSFYKNLRDPMAFFEAIRDIDEKGIEVVIAGRINEFADVLKKEGLCEKIKYRGFLSHKESLALQKSAAVLLHLGNLTDVQVPGKIYEYFSAGKPILCIKGSDIDLSAELIMLYNKGIVAGNDKKDIQEGILNLYKLWKNNTLDAQFNLDIKEDFTWRKRAEDIISIMERL